MITAVKIYKGDNLLDNLYKGDLDVWVKKCGVPVFSVEDNTIYIEPSEDGDTVMYTTDLEKYGWMEYTEPIPVDPYTDYTTLSAKCVKSGKADSEVVEYTAHYVHDYFYFKNMSTSDETFVVTKQGSPSKRPEVEYNIEGTDTWSTLTFYNATTSETTTTVKVTIPAGKKMFLRSNFNQMYWNGTSAGYKMKIIDGDYAIGGHFGSLFTKAGYDSYTYNFSGSTNRYGNPSLISSLYNNVSYLVDVSDLKVIGPHNNVSGTADNTLCYVGYMKPGSTCDMRKMYTNNTLVFPSISSNKGLNFLNMTSQSGAQYPTTIYMPESTSFKGSTSFLGTYSTYRSLSGITVHLYRATEYNTQIPDTWTKVWYEPTPEFDDWFYMENEEETASTLGITSNTGPVLEYSFDKSEWNTVRFTGSDWSVEVPANSKVYFKGTNPVLTSGTSTLTSFVLNGNRFSAGGNIISLLEAEWADYKTKLDDWAFCGLFINCSTLTDVSQINLGNVDTLLGVYHFYGMFNLCTSIEKGIDLSGITSSDGSSYTSMYLGCSSLSEITTPDLTSFASTNWVNGVSATGTMYFTNEKNLESIESGVNGCPSGWTKSLLNNN